MSGHNTQSLSNVDLLSIWMVHVRWLNSRWFVRSVVICSSAEHDLSRQVISSSMVASAMSRVAPRQVNPRAVCQPRSTWLPTLLGGVHLRSAWIEVDRSSRPLDPLPGSGSGESAPVLPFAPGQFHIAPPPPIDKHASSISSSPVILDGMKRPSALCYLVV